MKRTQHKRSPCPVACTLDLIGDKWTLLVVRDMLLGKKYFKDFSRSPEKIATNILTDRLEKLVEAELVERYVVMEEIQRDAYRLTDKGKSLHKIVELMLTWGLEHISGTEARLRPAESKKK